MDALRLRIFVGTLQEVHTWISSLVKVLEIHCLIGEDLIEDQALLSWDEALTGEALVGLEALIEDVLIWETLIIHVAFSSSSHTNCCGCQEVDGLVYIIIISLRAIAKFLVPLYLLTAFVTY
jgi:hypothetical protein